MLELLPGLVFNLPVALQSTGFAGTLYRLDCTAQLHPACYSFSWEWLNENAFTFAGGNLDYDFVIGNHIIDALLMYLPYS